MTPLLVVTCVVAALLLGAIVGWASRRHAHWCPKDGARLTCALCQPVAREVVRTGYPAHGRARVYLGTDPTPLMTPLAEQRTARIRRGGR
jgi:hypothetical protein